MLTLNRLTMFTLPTFDVLDHQSEGLKQSRQHDLHSESQMSFSALVDKYPYKRSRQMSSPVKDGQEWPWRYVHGRCQNTMVDLSDTL